MRSSYRLREDEFEDDKANCRICKWRVDLFKQHVLQLTASLFAETCDAPLDS
jgi:hypothetical protein